MVSYGANNQGCIGGRMKICNEHHTQIVYDELRNSCPICSSSSSYDKNGLCKTCRKNNVCNPLFNYKIIAMKCGKYIKRK